MHAISNVPTPLVTHASTLHYRLTKETATHLVAGLGAASRFHDLASAAAYARKASVGAAQGAQAVLDAGQGAYDVVDVLAKSASHFGGGVADWDAKLAKASAVAFHTQGSMPAWDTGPKTLGGISYYGESSTSAAGNLVAIVDGDTAFHVANGATAEGMAHAPS